MPAAPRTAPIAILLLGTIAAVSASSLLSGVIGGAGRWSSTPAVIFATGMCVAVARVSQWHPHRQFGPANTITSLRLLLTALVWGLVVEAPSDAAAAAAVVVSIVATALDGVDGRLARSSGLASPFGARFDMEVDALLILALSVLAWSQDKAGPWVLASGLMRYVFVAGGWLAPWLSHPLPPSRRRQTTCVLQVVALVVTIAPVMHRPASAAVAAAALAMLSASFGIDCLWLWRQRDRT